jgi:broad specificity phosphatase PhoE
LEQIRLDPWNFRPPNGESQADVAARMWAVTRRIMAERTEGKIAIVTHGVAIRAWMRELMRFASGMTWLIGIDNASITHFDHGTVNNEQVWILRRVNDAAHIFGL